MNGTFRKSIFVGPRKLPGEVVLPEETAGLVVFAHGSGSSRLSPRNRYVSEVLHQRRIGTLLFDLLTDAEAEDRSNVFDIELLGTRLGEALAWLVQRPDTSELATGLFGASTGAAAALVCAARYPDRVAAVVSRGGRPDLAGAHLRAVSAPTLLIVGGDDYEVLQLNRSAWRELRCEKRLEVVPGATHLFEEPGTLETVADLAADWFGRYLVQRASHDKSILGSQ
jgi:putative phosphoribosyl transferase